MTAKMRHAVKNPRISWKTLVASATDPMDFARELQSSLQALTDDGYHIVSQLQRGAAVIITGQRVELPAGYDPTQPQEQGPTPPPKARIVQAPAPPPQSSTSSEVLYHWLEHGQDRQQAFPSMLEALRLAKSHIEIGEPLLPVRIVAVVMTQYDLPSIPALLKVYATQLQGAPVKPLG